jgi:DNA-binding MarR family transcriptional regulator
MVMSMLAVEPGITPNRVCSVIGMDKALVGRSLKSLDDKGLVSVKPNGADGRSKILTLTREGDKLHDKIIQVALSREQQAVASLSSKEVELLISLLNKVRKDVVRMQTQG